MGAEQFECTSNLPFIEDAFRACVDQACYDYGHRGYTGTIAEKAEYVIIQKDPLPFDQAQGLARSLFDESDSRIDDKWGPAGAIPLLPTGWLFFGWASS